MDIEQFGARVRSVDWHEYDGPEWYEADKVTPALMALATVDVEDYSRMFQYDPDDPMQNMVLNSVASAGILYAAGNGHCGTYYPAAYRALAFIAEIALAGNTLVTRNSALSAMIDLYFFDYDPGARIEEQERAAKIAEMKAEILAYVPRLQEQMETDVRSRPLFALFMDDLSLDEGE